VINSLAQVVLKITSPGVPDFYQGTELWDFNLVDPDNRRPVDYEIRKKVLSEIKTNLEAQPRNKLLKTLLDKAEDGAVKLFTTWVALNFRREHGELFQNGAYSPLPSRGLRSENVVAFTRSLNGQSVLVATPRWIASTGAAPEKLYLSDFWKDTALEAEAGRYRNIFTFEMIDSASSLKCAELFQRFPVAIWSRISR
jgi:(1->4)-alpha-D-glucan 1-alpha-D-glucosylmutase